MTSEWGSTNQFITAAAAGRIADDYMVPHFRNNDYGTGLMACYGVA